MRHVRKLRLSRDSPDTFHHEAHLDIQKVFTELEEKLHVAYLKMSAKFHYELTIEEVRSLAY